MITPGPWRAEGPDMFGDYNILHGGDSLAVGAVVSNLRPPDEVAANAAMAAAAPLLFDALREMSEWWAYAIGKPRGFKPTTEDLNKVEALAQKAINALHAADATYVHRLPGSAH